MKKILLFFLVVILCLPLIMRGQVEVTIGTGTFTMEGPIHACEPYSWSESIYTAAEVGMEGTITQLAFNVSSNYAYSVSSFKIYMGTRSDSTFSGATDWTPAYNLTEVYSATNTIIGASTGWIVYTLDAPFVYSATENLVIAVSHTSNNVNCVLNYYGTSSTSKYMYRETDDDITYSQHPGTATGELESIRPNVKLTIDTTSLTCLYPTAVSISNVNNNSATLGWTAGGTESQWDIVLNTTGVAPDSTTAPDYTIFTNTHTFTNLTSSTQYYAYVRANCGAGNASIWRAMVFLTSQISAQFPYNCNFEDTTENAQWTLDNNNGTNKWYIDTADNNTDNGAYALYISGDSGVTTNYNITATSTVWAYRDIDFDTYTEYEVSFDIKGYGESCCDYVLAYIGPPAAPTGTSTPSGASQLVGNGTSGRFNLNSTWYHYSTTLDSSFSGLNRLYFLWSNDFSGGTSPGAVIDNIQVTGSDCGTPSNVTVDSTTSSSIAFQFTPAFQSDSTWEVVIVAPGDTLDETQAITITSHTHEFTNLTPNTVYTIYIRTNCGSEYSFWSSGLSVRTDCPDYITLPYSEYFDTYGATGSSVHPNCWTRMSAYNTNYPYVSATHYSSPSSLYFYSGSSSNNLIALPLLDPTIPVNSTTISFMMRASGTTAAYAITVGVMDSLDANSFTPVASVYPSVSNTWEEKEVIFTNYTGAGQYIAFKYAPSSSYSCYIDDVDLFLTPSCIKPMDVTINNVTISSADVNWTARGTETTWQIAVVPYGTSVSNATIEYATSQPYTVSNLQDNTQYDLYVRADCGGGDVSVWSTAYTFTTKCVATSTIPYTEDFESYGMGGASYFPTCWTRHQVNTTTQYPYITSVNSNGVLNFYSTSTVMTYAASQMLDLSNETPGTLTITFDVRKTGSTFGRLDVGYMTDADDINTFHLIKAIYPDDYVATQTWYTHTVTLPTEAYTSNVYIAFKAPSGYTNYVYLDNVVVDHISSCPIPTNLTISNIAGTSAMVSWTAVNDVNGYTLEYSEQGQQGFAISAGIGSQRMLSGLSPQTTYEVRLYSHCSSGYSDTLTTTFVTPCLVGGNITIGNGSTTNSYMPSYTYYNYSYVQEVYLASELGGAQTINSISLQCATNASPNRTYQIYLMHTTSTGPSSAWLPFDSAKLVFTGTVSWQVGWNQIIFDTLFQYNGTNNLAVLILDNTGTYSTANTFYTHSYSGSTRYVYTNSSAYNPASINSTGTVSSLRNNIIFGSECDNLTTCVAPNVYVLNYNSSSVEIGWAAGYNESSWELAYKLSSDTTWTSEGIVTGSSYTLTGLSSNATYDIRMRSVCGAGEYSGWGATSVFIPCYVTSLPFMEDFDGTISSGTSTYDNYVSCWSRITNYSDSYPYCSTTQHHSGNYSLYFYGTSAYYSYAVLPRFDDSILMDSLQIKFWAYKTSAAYQIEVGIMTDASDPNTFVTVGYFSPSATSTWERTEVNTNSYMGEGHYVAFRIPAWYSNYMYLDDVNIYYISECTSVENIQANNIGTTSADITWTAGDSESSWDIIYGTSVDLDIDQSTTVFTNTATLTGLTPNMSYTVYVRAVCDNGGYSAWMSYTFRTECTPISYLPFSEDFESYAGGSSELNITPYCWDRINNGTASAGCPTVYTSSSTYFSSGTKGLYFYATSASGHADQYAILPELDTTSIQLNTLRLSLYARRYLTSTTFQNYVVVGVMTDKTDAATFVPVDTITFIDTTIQRYDIDFNNYTGNGCYIAIKAPKPTSPLLYNYTYLDDISLDFSPSCIVPTNLAVSAITQTEATATWTAGGNESSWNVQYKTAADSVWGNSINVSTPTYTLTGLTDNTAYEVRVQAVCDTNNTSDWTSAVAFTTLEEVVETCPAPTGLAATTVDNESVTLSWSQEANTADSWQVEYREQGATAWNTTTATAVSYTLTGLTGLTTYEIQVLANCTNGLISDPSNMITVTTTNTGITDYDLESHVRVFPNPTAGYVTILSESLMERVEVYDVYGKLIYTFKVEDSSAEVDMSCCAVGVYFLRIQTENGLITKRIVKK